MPPRNQIWIFIVSNLSQFCLMNFHIILLFIGLMNSTTIEISANNCDRDGSTCIPHQIPKTKGNEKSFFNFIDKITKSFCKIYDGFKIIAVIEIGKTGLGKSTLLNTFFSGSLVKTGIEEPATKFIKSLKKDGAPLTNNDNHVLKLDYDNQESFERDLSDLIEQILDKY